MTGRGRGERYGAMATTTRLSLKEFLAMPETEPASEYICGEVIQKPMPDQAHALLQLYLGSLILNYLARTRLGRVATEWRCIFGPRGRKRAWIPDLVFVSNDRLPKGDPRRHRFLRTAPDLAIEVVSPNQPMGRFSEKIDFYLLYGVRLVWVIDQIAESVTVHAPGAEPRTLAAGDLLDGGDILPEFSVAVRDIFAQLDA